MEADLRMVDALLNGLPEDWEACIGMDRSSGFWENMKALEIGCNEIETST
jgi:hypothetical protein